MAWRRRSCPASIKLLIEFGANPCFRSAGGECPLVAAVVSKRYSPAAADIVKTLLQAAEDQSIPLDVVESQVEEALDVAERGEHTIILRPLRYWYWRSKYPVPS
ncbi:hypothetical protein BJY04DRAFT_199260 [Aspergillus karnatakaensis]|uniref:uncharacterized protein n=1 Tax=Aspergillus karnatakaensis TaxID=1810916 RepID=UPI003CCDF66A